MAQFFFFEKVLIFIKKLFIFDKATQRKKTMKTIVIDKIRNRRFEFEGSMSFDDERLRKIKDEVKEDLGSTVWNGNDKTFTLHSKESQSEEIRQEKENLFKRKGIPSHVICEVLFYNAPVMVRDSQLRRDFADIGEKEYRTLKIPYDQYDAVMKDLETVDCKIIGSNYVWTNNE